MSIYSIREGVVKKTQRKQRDKASRTQGSLEWQTWGFLKRKEPAANLLLLCPVEQDFVSILSK